MKGLARRVLPLLGLLGLSACGGSSGGSVTAPPAPPPPPPPPTAMPQIDVQRVFPDLGGFAAPVSLVQAPGDATRWFVVEQSGIVRVFDNDANVNSSGVFVNISNRVLSGGERGLLGIAFHPDFPNTAEVYLSYTAPGGSAGISYVSRFGSADGGATLDPNSEEIVLTVIQDFSNHNGGDLAFGQDGFLYASFGDGGSGGDPNDRGQDTANLLGTILRVNIDGVVPYEIPGDNPFASPDLCVQGFSSGTPCPEIYAYGLRNPWRMSFDSATGELWTGDVGQGAWEEIDRVVLGGNYGWDDREGAHCFEPASGCIESSLDPITEYGRGLGASVTGGYVYRGTTISDLLGFYVFGDFVSGRVFAVPADSQPTVLPDEMLETTLSISTFAEDTNGELYVVDYGSGTIFQIVAAP